MRRALLLTSALACLLAPNAFAGGPAIMVGAVEDGALQGDMVAAKAKMDLARLAGFNAVRLTMIWQPGQSAPTAADMLALKNAAGAAQLDGIRAIVNVRNPGGKTAPVTIAARGQFARYTAAIARSIPGVTDFIVGNEPNLNRFWLPQFGPKGSNAAAAGYEKLLALTYDQLKAVSRKINVIGGAVSPRGEDKAKSVRPTHSPTTFLRDLGTAYKKSKRKKPIMDMLAIHGYQQKSSIKPTVQHPKGTTITIADYPKLVKILTKAFKGTKQPGARLPILWGEFGVQSQIPAAKQDVYTNLSAPAGNDAVSEATQGRYYRQALQLAYCQKNVAGLLIFHVSDEPDLDRWQSGLYYADDSPKSDFPIVRDTIAAMRERAMNCIGVNATHPATQLPLLKHRPVALDRHGRQPQQQSRHAGAEIRVPAHACRVRSGCAGAVHLVHVLRR